MGRIATTTTELPNKNLAAFGEHEWFKYEVIGAVVSTNPFSPSSQVFVPNFSITETWCSSKCDKNRLYLMVTNARPTILLAKIAACSWFITGINSGLSDGFGKSCKNARYFNFRSTIFVGTTNSALETDSSTNFTSSSTVENNEIALINERITFGSHGLSWIFNDDCSSHSIWWKRPSTHRLHSIALVHLAHGTRFVSLVKQMQHFS